MAQQQPEAPPPTASSIEESVLNDAEGCRVWVSQRARASCPTCNLGFVQEVDVNIGGFLHTVTRAEMYLRVVGTRINATRERDTTDVIVVLEWIAGLLTRAVDPSASPVFVCTSDAEFTSKVVPVLGAVELLLLSDFRWVESGGYLIFSPIQHHPRWTSRRAASVLRLVREELALLYDGKRRFTSCVFDDEHRVLAEFDHMVEQYQRPDSYPNFEDALRWMRIRDFFLAAAHLTKETSGSIRHLLQAEQATRYLEKVLIYSEGYARSEVHTGLCILQSCRLSEEMQMNQYLCKERETCLTPSKHRGPASEQLNSPVQESPGVMLTRTPHGDMERQEYEMALPSPSCLTREPRSQYAGLLNVVQNCFMNCLLQSYYMCQHFTDAVLRFPCRDEWQGEVPQAVKLIHRLQAVFAFLEHSCMSCVNPKYVLQSVGTLYPHFMDGGQHDPHEFADCFIDMLLKGVGEGGQSVHLIKEKLGQLLKGEAVEISVARSGAVGEERRESFLHFLPLYFPPPTLKSRTLPPATPTRIPSATPPPLGSRARHVASNAPVLPLTPSTPSTSALVTPITLITPPAPSPHGSDSSSASRRLFEPPPALFTHGGVLPNGSFVNDGLLSPSSPLAPSPSPAPKQSALEILVGYEAGYPSLNVLAQLLQSPPTATDVEPAPHDDPRVSLYDCLDQMAIDFKDGASSTATTMKCFSRLPHLLMFYLPARTALQGEQSVPVDFDATIHLDRYADTVEAGQARDRCRRLLAEEKRLESVLQQREELIDHLQTLVEKNSAFLGTQTETHASLTQLISTHRIEARNAALSLDKVRRDISHSFDGLPKCNAFTYHLHAVIIHEQMGDSGGHFYSYALDTRRDPTGQRWVRFDDAKVTTVHLDEVFSQHTRRNVYCMFYESDALRRNCDINIKIPPSLRRVIEHEDSRRQERLARRYPIGALCP